MLNTYKNKQLCPCGCGNEVLTPFGKITHKEKTFIYTSFLMLHYGIKIWWLMLIDQTNPSKAYAIVIRSYLHGESNQVNIMNYEDSPWYTEENPSIKVLDRKQILNDPFLEKWALESHDYLFIHDTKVEAFFRNE